MEPEDYVMRVAYFVLFITLALMTWAVSVQAEQASPLISSNPAHTKLHPTIGVEEYPPCSFNLLCSCSKPGPSEFGIVACHDIPFANTPLSLNTSRAFMLSMVRNNLQVLEEKRLISSGLWRLEIRENKLQHIADDAFIGLTKFLTELDLQNNELTAIPSAPIRRLAKLRLLNLSGNKITDVDSDDFEAFPPTLNCLSLAGNLIANIPEGAFANLPKLENLDLSGNSIQLVHGQAFLGVTRSLDHLYLSHNLLQKIPFEALSILKLKYLDLSHNLLSSTFDIYYQGKLSVGSVSFDHNRIHMLPAFSFQNFKQAKAVSLANNPLIMLVDDAFKEVNIDNLDLSHCYIHSIEPLAFRGLQKSLQKLDLSFNNITEIPPDLFENFGRLREVNLDKNRVSVIPEQFMDFQFTLHRFSLVEDSISAVPMEELRVMRNLRSLNISNFGSTTISTQVFEGFGLSIEDLKISYAKVTSVRGSAFLHLTGLKFLDLSNNKIGKIDENAFDEVGHSIVRLKVTNSLRMNSIPPQVLQRLTALHELDLSSNALTSIGDASFDKADKLTHLNLRFNKIGTLSRKVFQATKLPRLQYLAMSFNALKEIKESTFANLKSLEYLELNENSIQTLHRRSFEDLTALRVLNLAGNKISLLVDEAFLNLPRLQLLDLSNNAILKFNIDAFEQLGTLGSCRIDVSHNKITRLGPEPIQLVAIPKGTSPESSQSEESEELGPATSPSPLHLVSISSSSIESLDLSHNNISIIAPHFFGPISNTLIELDLSHNKLSNLTRDHLSGMRFVQHLDLSHNILDTIEYDSFRESKLIQVLNLGHNVLRDLPPDVFEDCGNLRVFEAPHNKIRSVTDALFKDTQLEILDLKQNFLVRFPEAALSRIASTLTRLDLSGNEISSVAPAQIECLQRLRWLNLASNRIVVIADSSLDTLFSLLYLDISGNPLGRINSRLFEEAKNTLLHLHLSNMSLEVLPDFDTFQKLLTFNVSFNSLTFLPTNFGVNVSTLRTLDISGNDIPAPPNTIWHTIPRLSKIVMHSNPIKLLTNESFLQLDRLHELDISELPLESLQVGMLAPLSCLKSFTIGPLPGSVVNPGAVIQSTESLQHLHLKLATPMMKPELAMFLLPQKLNKVTISGQPLLSILDGAFEQVQNRQFHLEIRDTGITDLGTGVLQDFGEANEISLEIRGNNSLLKSIANPNSQFKPEPFATYLTHFQTDPDFSIACSCDSGWIEFWLRQWMETKCPISIHTELSMSPTSECNTMLRSLRAIQCVNKPGSDLLEAFVSELECGWDSSATVLRFQSNWFVFAVGMFLINFH